MPTCVMCCRCVTVQVELERAYVCNVLSMCHCACGAGNVLSMCHCAGGAGTCLRV